MGKIWFVTGSSRGLGHALVTSALERGDRVAATARNPEGLERLRDRYADAVLPLALDVTDTMAVTEAVTRAHEHFGRLDVVVNNAGYGLFGAVEELDEEAVRAQLDTNLLGPLRVVQAVLPILREQGSGHILQVSSVGGVLAFPALGGYHASKWALEGLSESLAQETSGFGVKVTLVEPGSYDTDWGGPSATHSQPHPAYDPLREALGGFQLAQGDPRAAAAALLEVADADAPPLRVILGEQPLGFVDGIYRQRLAEWDAWSDLSRRATGLAVATGVPG